MLYKQALVVQPRWFQSCSNPVSGGHNNTYESQVEQQPTGGQQSANDLMTPLGF